MRTKDVENTSAMAYLLGFSGDDFFQQQTKLKKISKKQPLSFEYRLLETEQEMLKMPCSQTTDKKLSYKQRQRSLYTNWRMSSYTALSSLSIDEAPELPIDKVREENQEPVKESNNIELPRGAHTGNVIHDLLENIPFKYLAEDTDISVQRKKSCLRYGLKTENPELINQLLKSTVKTLLSLNDSHFSLKDLKEDQCLKEMPFYLAMKKIDVSLINRVLKDYPTYQPLSEKTMSGFLTGFIDLICEYQGKYFIIDYKSNGLESYDTKSLTQAMREHNYGLQYWIYTLVLHQYLKHRLPNYDFKKHMGGVMYLFVRGMDENIENSGVYQAKPKLEMIEQLAELFI
jgi:exodeoxyribonuclease V beta subunit